MKAFKSENLACAWAASELLATLEEDLRRMCTEEREHYTDEDRSMMEAKIEDIRSVSIKIAAAASSWSVAQLQARAPESFTVVGLYSDNGQVWCTNVSAGDREIAAAEAVVEMQRSSAFLTPESLEVVCVIDNVVSVQYGDNTVPGDQVLAAAEKKGWKRG